MGCATLPYCVLVTATRPAGEAPILVGISADRDIESRFCVTHHPSQASSSPDWSGPLRGWGLRLLYEPPGG